MASCFQPEARSTRSDNHTTRPLSQLKFPQEGVIQLHISCLQNASASCSRDESTRMAMRKRGRGTGIFENCPTNNIFSPSIRGTLRPYLIRKWLPTRTMRRPVNSCRTSCDVVIASCVGRGIGRQSEVAKKGRGK